MAGYSIELAPDDNGTFLITAPALPEVTSFAESETEVETNARAALEEAVAARMAAGVPLPDWSTAGRIIHLPMMSGLKASLHRALMEEGRTRAELARSLGWHREQVDRLFRLGHASRLDQLEAAFGALGRRIDLLARKAA